MKKANIMPSVVLGAICLIVALLLSLVNMVTAPIIEAAQNAAANEALVKIYPGGTDFKAIDISKYTLPDSITAAYSEGSGGYVIQSTVTGYNPGLVVMCGIDKDGKIVGADYIASKETLSAEVGLGDRFVGKDKDEMSPDLVAGSTAKLTTNAYYKAIVDALNAFVILNGGTVNLDTPEQILQKNCNAALGTTDVKFSKWFATEVIEGIDAVYVAEDNSGRVYVIGESFIGVKADGTIVNLGNADEAVISTADQIISASALESVDKPQGASKQITKIFVTPSGNYVFEVKAQGFSAHYYGDEIVIKVCISSDGKIIDCLTVSHSESKGYGDICATDEYYASWIGITADKVVISTSPVTDATVDPGAISGATYTTEGYQKAIRAAFNAFEIIVGLGGED